MSVTQDVEFQLARMEIEKEFMGLISAAAVLKNKEVILQYLTMAYCKGKIAGLQEARQVIAENRAEILDDEPI